MLNPNLENLEILAPCGSEETLDYALAYGANAVYIGLKNFSARNNAENFDENALVNAVRKCRLHGVKLYVALNTLIFDDEIADFRRSVILCAEAGVNAIIIQDLGAAKTVKEIAPNMPLHASTQTTTTSVSGVKALSKLGFKRIVLARELSFSELTEIDKAAEALGVETEVFIHGARCVSVSGQCYASAFFKGSDYPDVIRSGNRGLCAQPCRLNFKSNTRDYALSLKDLSLIEHLSELKRLKSLKSLKIEGRMKRPEYVAASIIACRNALNANLSACDLELLKDAFSRGGFSDGDFTGNYSNMNGVRSKEDVLGTLETSNRFKLSNPCKRYKINFEISIKLGEPVKLIASVNDVEVTLSGKIPETAINPKLTNEAIKAQLSKLGGTIFEAGEIKIEADLNAYLNAYISVAEINSLRRGAVEALSEKIIEKNIAIERKM